MARNSVLCRLSGISLPWRTIYMLYAVYPTSIPFKSKAFISSESFIFPVQTLLSLVYYPNSRLNFHRLHCKNTIYGSPKRNQKNWPIYFPLQLSGTPLLSNGPDRGSNKYCSLSHICSWLFEIYSGYCSEVVWDLFYFYLFWMRRDRYWPFWKCPQPDPEN